MQIVVLFKEDGSHEIVKAKDGLEFKVDTLILEGVRRLYMAKSVADANIAIDVLGENDG